jgi:cell division protein FtsL
MASWGQSNAAAADPQLEARPRGRAQFRDRRRTQAHGQRRVAGGVVWIVVLAVLLAGVVAVNVAVLRLNVQLDKLGSEKVDLRSQNAELQSQVSSALAAPRIQALARQQLGLVPASPDTTQYVQLGRPSR